ncbi:hypothetical protein [Alcanivorax quisquiliarum]|uniref:Uncharacterized protein n=1 Tax=Alcanivorax quisquiliarum TaxID=2933565 RepID=A0ABT0E570_9GAMM|nr:hypothetical protein [Alcanivorax quisquiliarum]MCK0536834.1 hypothetical protein [Alcanivorax quisquiliarum]
MEKALIERFMIALMFNLLALSLVLTLYGHIKRSEYGKADGALAKAECVGPIGKTRTLKLYLNEDMYWNIISKEACEKYADLYKEGDEVEMLYVKEDNYIAALVVAGRQYFSIEGYAISSIASYSNPFSC